VQVENRIAASALTEATPHGRNPFVFVVGCPRSGTTLLQRMLDHHPSLAVANDTHFIPRTLEKHAPRSVNDALAGREIPLTADLAAAVVDYRRFHRLGVGAEAAMAAAEDTTTYRGFVSALYRHFALGHGKPLGGEKTPDYVRRIPLLASLFPWARFVHLIRDGRDVALSVLEWAGPQKGPGKLELWETEPVATSALWWRRQVKSGLAGRTAVGFGRYVEVRYQDLSSRPAAEMQRVAEFLGLPYQREMLSFHEGKTKSDTSLSAKSRWLPPTPGLRKWREQMPASEIAVFEALAGDVLDELGFERHFSVIPRDAEIRAAKCTRWWNAHLARREAKVRRRMEERS
jgi:hypothetical protein